MMTDNLLEILRSHQDQYPLMTAQDMVKLVFQNEFAGGHMISDEKAALDRLRGEMKTVTWHSSILFEAIGNHLCRLHLGAIPKDMTPETINRFFTLTANGHKGTIASFETKLSQLVQGVQQGDLGGDLSALEAMLDHLKALGYPAVHHSQEYRINYHPAYRVVSQVFQSYFELFHRIDQLMGTQEKIIIAIDGHCGSGKSTLASLLKMVYQVPVLSMDDFYLPMTLKTRDRLLEPGGNVHYERFEEEVLIPITKGEPFDYQVFDCGSQVLEKAQRFEASPLWIVEGSYSHHPHLAPYYDLKVFLKIPSEIQHQRILARNGPVVYERFVNQWIPLEKTYFHHWHIESKSHLIYDTSRIENVL